MAEGSEKRLSSVKSQPQVTNYKMLGEDGLDNDILGQSGKKKVKPPKDTVTINMAHLQSSQTTLSMTSDSNNSASKTVAAILKQSKDHVQSPKDHRGQQQMQNIQLQLHQHTSGSKKKGKSVGSTHAARKVSHSPLLTQLNMSSPQMLTRESPLSHVGSPQTIANSPNMSPLPMSMGAPHTGLSSMNNTLDQHNLSSTTKASSLSRDISPSRITAQIVKVMEESTPSSSSPSSVPNLLRSALQGTMPDPMIVLNNNSVMPSSLSSSAHLSSASSSSSSVDTVVYGSFNSPGSVSNINSNPATPGTNVNNSNNSVINNNISMAPSYNNHLQLQQNNSFTPMISSSQPASLHYSDVNTYTNAMASATTMVLQPQSQPGQQQFQLMAFQACDLDELPPAQSNMSTVENLLASSDGTIQTVNVSHIPKSMALAVSSPGNSAGSQFHHPQQTNVKVNRQVQHQLQRNQPASSKSAMEIAQQIKMEANGQKSSLKPGMQQHLRTQIQGSRSIDAQLTTMSSPEGSSSVTASADISKVKMVSPVAVATKKKSSAKTANQLKSLEASMPLLAAKLAPGKSTTATKNVSPCLSSSMSTTQSRPLPQAVPLSVTLSNTRKDTGQIPMNQQSLSALQPVPTSSSTVNNNVQQLNMDNVLHRQQQHQLMLGLISSSSSSPQQQQQHTHQPFQFTQSLISNENIELPQTLVDGSNAWSVQHSNLLPDQHQVPSATFINLNQENQQQQQLVLQQQIQVNTPPPLNLSGGLGKLLSGLDKQQTLEKLLQASISSSLAQRQQQNHLQDGEQEYHNLNLHQLLTSNLGEDESQNRSIGGASLASLISAASMVSSSSSTSTSQLSTSGINSAMQALMGRLSQDVRPPESTTISQGSNTSVSTALYSSLALGSVQPELRLGDSQNTAIDVDMDSDIGNLTSIVSNKPNINIFQQAQKQNMNKYLTSNQIGKQQITCTASNILKPNSFCSVSQTLTSSPSLSKLASTNVLGCNSFRSLPPPPHYTPPPPYPAKQNHCLSAQLPMDSPSTIGKTTCSSAGVTKQKHIQNPFTFPTTGVSINPDINTHAFLSYPLNSNSTHNNNLNEGTVSNFHPAMINNGAKSSIFSPTSTVTNTTSNVESFTSFRAPLTVGSGSVYANQSSTTSHKKVQPTNKQKGANGGSRQQTSLSSPLPSSLPNNPQQRLGCESSQICDNHNKKSHPINKNNNVTKSEDNHDGSGEQLELMSTQPFNQRISNLMCFPVMNSTYRAAYRSHSVAVQRARSGVITNIAKSLDILRQNLQCAINKEITDIVRKYSDKYFTPALENIRQNNNNDFVGKEHLNYVCRQILEEAKSEFMPEIGRSSRSVTPSDMADNASETGSLNGRKASNMLKRAHISDSESEKGSDGGFKRKITKKKGRPSFQNTGRVTPSKTYKAGDPVKREGPKWDPARLKTDTLMVMGARANKALGYGNTRGRLYIRHPDVFKYIGDADDKSWLYDNNLLPATGGKAYMLLLEDIEDLSKSDEYKFSPMLMMHECVGFTVPEWMLVKMKEQMGMLRSDGHKPSISFSSIGNTDTNDTKPKVLPFSAFTAGVLKEESLSAHCYKTRLSKGLSC